MSHELLLLFNLIELTAHRERYQHILADPDNHIQIFAHINLSSF